VHVEDHPAAFIIVCIVAPAPSAALVDADLTLRPLN